MCKSFGCSLSLEQPPWLNTVQALVPSLIVMSDEASSLPVFFGRAVLATTFALTMVMVGCQTRVQGAVELQVCFCIISLKSEYGLFEKWPPIIY